MVMIQIDSVYSQDSLKTDAVPTPGISIDPLMPALSERPTAQEFADYFTSQKFDPIMVVQAAIRIGEIAVPALSQLLLDASIRSSETAMDTGWAVPNRMFTIKALEGIGGRSAFGALTVAAGTHPEPEIRALAMNALAGKYYQVTRTLNESPDPTIVQAFLANTDDNTYVGHLQRSVGSIALEGLTVWLGIDFGDPKYEQARLTSSRDSKEVSAGKYARIWWQERSSKVKWNRIEGHFDVQE
jgi:hypothetical protein